MKPIQTLGDALGKKKSLEDIVKDRNEKLADKHGPNEIKFLSPKFYKEQEELEFKVASYSGNKLGDSGATFAIYKVVDADGRFWNLSLNESMLSAAYREFGVKDFTGMVGSKLRLRVIRSQKTARLFFIIVSISS